MYNFKSIWILPLLFLANISNSEASISTYNNEVNCLVKNMFYEAGDQGKLGQIAVAHVTLNRVRKNFAKSICAVVYQKSQFSWTNDRRLPRIKKQTWDELKKLAMSILEGEIKSNVGSATRFHAVYVHPGWKGRVTKIGQHIFYK